jgi:dolichol-phosphate mannosyltransferase
VPAYEVTEIADRSQSHCVAVFVINEGQRLWSQLERMAAAHAPVDVLIADGGSTDGSMDLSELKARGVNTRLVKRGEGKLGAQMRMAFDFALNRGYEGVIVMDGNDKDDPEALPRFVAALEDGIDHVQGSRFVPGGRSINTPLSRLLGIRLLHAPLISRAGGVRYTDTTNGFRAYSRRFLTDPRVSPFRDVFEGYELHYYLAIRAAELGFRVREIPVTRAYPDKGPVPTKISPVKGNLRVLERLFAACAHRFDPRADHGA